METWKATVYCFRNHGHGKQRLFERSILNVRSRKDLDTQQYTTKLTDELNTTNKLFNKKSMYTTNGT